MTFSSTYLYNLHWSLDSVTPELAAASGDMFDLIPVEKMTDTDGTNTIYILQVYNITLIPFFHFTNQSNIKHKITYKIIVFNFKKKLDLNKFYKETRIQIFSFFSSQLYFVK